MVKEAGGSKDDISADFLAEVIHNDIDKAYAAREASLTPTVMRELERRVILTVLDRKWREHLYEMDYLKEGIGLRAMAQKDPLVEYQREGYDLFMAMMDAIKEESIGFLFNVEVKVSTQKDFDGDGVVDEVQVEAKGLEASQMPAQLSYTAPSETGEIKSSVARTTSSEYENVGRNDECPCGSGKKFKKCHGDPANR